MRYSLANYILTIEAKEGSEIRSIFGSLSIGGQGSAIGDITISRPAELYSTKGYSTGGWVHSKNLDKTGTISVDINQMSPEVADLINLGNALYDNDFETGLQITVKGVNDVLVASALDCYITRIPDQKLGTEASDQTWTFTCGQIDII